MNKKFFSILISLIVTLTLFFHVLNGRIMINKFDKNLNHALKNRLSHFLVALTPPLRQHLIMGNIRSARIDLHKYIQQEIIEAYSIERAGKILDSSTLTKASSTMSINVPIYFSSDNNEKWGSITYIVKTSTISNLIKNFVNDLWKGSLYILVINILLLLSAFYLIWSSAKYLTPILNSYINERVPNNINQLTSLFWSPLLQKIRHQFDKSQAWKLEFIKNERDAEKGRVSAQVAHDIRSPLALIKNIFSNENESSHSYNLQILAKAYDRIESIVQDLLKGNNFKIDESYNLETAIFEIRDEKKAEYPEHNLTLQLEKIEVECILPKVQLQRILSNLINNSIEATKDTSSEIILITKETRESITISIKDFGVGIPKDVLERIGTRGFSFNKEKGNGLGLYGAKATLSKYGGDLLISSNSLETIISLVLPKELPAKDDQVLSSQSIILLDNDPLIQMIWKSSAKKSEKNLLVYSKYEDLLSDLSSISTECTIYVDNNLEATLSGLEVCEDLFKRGFHQLILATGDELSHQDYPYLKEIIGKEPPF